MEDDDFPEALRDLAALPVTCPHKLSTIGKKIMWAKRLVENFQKLDQPSVREHALRIASLPAWTALAQTTRKRVLETNPMLERKYRGWKRRRRRTWERA